jgi:hypothetical protein
VGEVKVVDEVEVRVACRGVRSRGDRRSEIEVDPKRRGLLLKRLLVPTFCIGAYFLY